MKKILKTNHRLSINKRQLVFIVALLYGCLGFSSLSFSGVADSLAISVADGESIRSERNKEEIKVPDISGVTAGAIASKIPLPKPGKVDIQKISNQDDLIKFLYNFRLPELITLQGQWPEAIVIHSGVLTVDELYQAVANKNIMSRTGNAYLLRRPLLIKSGASLIIDDQVEDLRFSQEKGAFLVNSGDLFIINTNITAWSESNDMPAWFKEGEDNRFRPFILSWSGSNTRMAKSTITSFGYLAGKSYGISLSSGPVSRLRKEVGLKRPTGWIVDNRFVDMYYGFYSYEADDVVLLRNKYENNIVYGIDPHDRSERLVIAHNEVYGVKQKHGIIISREVNNSFIFSNYSHDNKGSGFMLDRSSENNLVTNNVAINNGGDGITLFESSHNTVNNNRVINNKRHGIHVRNSMQIKVDDNFAFGNKEYGIYTQVKKEFTDGRNLELDPYIPTTTIHSVNGNTIENNGSGAFSFTDTEYIALGLNNIMPNPKGIFRGQLQPLQPQLLDLMLKQKKWVAIDLKPDLGLLSKN